MSEEDLQMQDDNDGGNLGTTLELQRRLLNKTKTDKVNTLLKKNLYDNVGSNGIFASNPSVVKFAGFEIKKTHTQRVRLINNSPAPQRLHILPPSTPYFKIRYSKKGMVPSGIAEEIYVQFTPNDEYKYYYDCIRIHCEGDKILIPIHAFPVINSKKDEIVPNFIDMGKGLKVGQTYTSTINIESNCPVNFEYDIEIIKPHPDIFITPLSGDILGMQTTQIQITYTPNTFTTAEAEIQFRTSEFDSQPKKIRINGSALPSKINVNTQEVTTDDQYGQSSQKGKYEEYDVKKTKTRTLLTNKKEMRPSQKATAKLEKLPEKAFSQPRDMQSSQMKGTGSQLDIEDIPLFKNSKFSKEESDFIREYRHFEELEREKGIKFFQCIGDPPSTQNFIDGIKTKRSDLIDLQQREMRGKDILRFVPAIDQDRVVVDTQLDLTEKPKWDAFQNNHFAMRRRLVQIFLKVSNKLITRMRAGKRLQKIKEKLRSQGVKNKADAKRMVQEDWKNAQNIRLTDDDTEDNIANVKFKFCFNEDTIDKAQMKLPLEYETNIASFMEKVEARPPINFDDLVPFDSVEQLDFEVHKYQKFTIPPMSQYDPVEAEKIHRPGCEYESLLRQRRGEPDLEKLQLKAHDQQKLLKQEKKDIVSGAIVNMPKTFLKPLDYSIDLLVRSHPTLREYQRQRNQAETDPDSNLFTQVRPREDPKDEIMMRNTQGGISSPYALQLTKTVGGAIVNTLEISTSTIPGNFGVRVIEQMPTNLSEIWRERKNTQLGFACQNESSKVPQMLEAPRKVDYPTDEDSDDNVGFSIKMPEITDLINEFEKDDDALYKENESLRQQLQELKIKGIEKEPREEMKDQRGDKIQHLDKNITVQREELASKLPGMVEDVNEVIKYSKNKIYLR